MIFSSEHQICLLLRTYARIASMVIATIGGLVLLGWTLDSPVLKSLSPAWVSMKANTAICFLAIGLSLIALSLDSTKRRYLLLGRVCAGITFAIGALTLCEYFLDWDLGIDQLLFMEPVGAVGTFSPGRMAPNTAFNFVLIGVALGLMQKETPRSISHAQIVALPATFIALLAFVGYLYDVTILYGIFNYTKMAMHTAVAFLIVGLGIFFARPEHGFMAIVAANTSGGAILRRLVPASILLLLGGGWLSLWGERKGLYDTEFGLAVLTMLCIAIMVPLLYSTAHSLHQVDVAHRELIADLECRTLELTAVNKELEAFSYSVSHDLRAPLRSIDGFSQAVLEDCAGKLSAESAGHLARVRAASQRMARLIDDLLNLSRITRAELRRTKVDLSALAEAAAQELKSAEPGRAVEWSIQPALVVDGDESLLRVVLQNFLGNAWKFTSKTARARIELSSFRQPDGTPAYYARDNGAGFDGAYAHKLFGAFQRLHDEADFPGTGVGLATIQRIVHRHGGRVWTQSVPGQGATFYFTIPAPAERTS